MAGRFAFRAGGCVWPGVSSGQGRDGRAGESAERNREFRVDLARRSGRGVAEIGKDVVPHHDQVGRDRPTAVEVELLWSLRAEDRDAARGLRADDIERSNEAVAE